MNCQPKKYSVHDLKEYSCKFFKKRLKEISPALYHDHIKPSLFEIFNKYDYMESHLYQQIKSKLDKGFFFLHPAIAAWYLQRNLVEKLRKDLTYCDHELKGYLRTIDKLNEELTKLKEK